MGQGRRRLARRRPGRLINVRVPRADGCGGREPTSLIIVGSETVQKGTTGQDREVGRPLSVPSRFSSIAFGRESGIYFPFSLPVQAIVIVGICLGPPFSSCRFLLSFSTPSPRINLTLDSGRTVSRRFCWSGYSVGALSLSLYLFPSLVVASVLRKSTESPVWKSARPFSCFGRVYPGEF